MATKKKGNETKLCQGKEVLERMNFLYQASQSMALKNVHLSSYYGDIMTKCSKKAVLRMEPGVKRTQCKKCSSPLIPGKTARVRLVSKPSKSVKWLCLTCGKCKKYSTPNKSKKNLWWDEPSALVDYFHYTQSRRKWAAQEKKDDATKSREDDNLGIEEPVHHDNKPSTKCGDAQVSIK